MTRIMYQNHGDLVTPELQQPIVQMFPFKAVILFNPGSES
jgi:hypothetical protein